MTPENRQLGLRHALRLVMEHISEELWRATWVHGLEYSLWGVATSPTSGAGQGVNPAPRNAALAALSEAIDGWIWWPDNTDEPQYISRANWLTHLDERRKATWSQRG